MSDFLKSDNTVIKAQLQNSEQKDQRIIKISNYSHRCKGNIKLRQQVQSKDSLSSYAHFRSQMSPFHRPLIISKQFWKKKKMLFYDSTHCFQKSGCSCKQNYRQNDTGRDPQDITGERLTIPLLPSCPSLALTLWPSIARLLWFSSEFFHEEIPLGTSLLLFLSDWINSEEPADDNKGIALQKVKTSYRHTHKTARLPPLPGVLADESRLPGLCPSSWGRTHLLLCRTSRLF